MENHKEVENKEMIWSTYNWKLVVTPKWIRTNKETEQVKCFSCNGRGWEDWDEDIQPLPCRGCHGIGTITRPVLIDAPPEMDEKFLAALKEFIDSYEDTPIDPIEKEPIKNVMPKIKGKAFRCECGCNVFHHPKPEDKLLYECNACGDWWRGE
jgi:hypothetical protein